MNLLWPTTMFCEEKVLLNRLIYVAKQGQDMYITDAELDALRLKLDSELDNERLS